MRQDTGTEDFFRLRLDMMLDLRAPLAVPDGHPKLPHLWPVKLPQARQPDYDVSVPLTMREAASLSR